VKAMRVKYEVYRDGDWLVAAAIVKFNKREEKRLAELLEDRGRNNALLSDNAHGS
jgi:hypothetical protein